MHFGLVLAQIFFLLEPLAAFFAFEGLFKVFEKAPSTFLRRISDRILPIGVNQDTENRTFLFIYFE